MSDVLLVVFALGIIVVFLGGIVLALIAYSRLGDWGAAVARAKGVPPAGDLTYRQGARGLIRAWGIPPLGLAGVAFKDTQPGKRPSST